MRRYGVTLALAVAAMGAAPFAFAGAASRLTFVRGPGAERCPAEAELRALVVERVGYDIFFPWARKTLVVAITASPKRGYRGDVKVVDGNGIVVGERTLDSKSDDCAALARALALTISIAVDDHSLDDVPPPATSAPAPAPAPSAGSAPPAQEVETVPRSEPPRAAVATPDTVLFSAWAEPIVVFEASPTTTAGGELSLSGQYRRFVLGVEVRGDVPSSTSLSQGGSVGTSLALASVVPCLQVPAPVLLCGIVGAGVFTESGQGFASPRSQSAPYAQAGGRVAIEVPLAGSVFVVANSDLLAPLTRHSVQVDGRDVFTVPALSFVMGIGVGVRL